MSIEADALLAQPTDLTALKAKAREAIDARRRALSGSTTTTAPASPASPTT